MYIFLNFKRNASTERFPYIFGSIQHTYIVQHYTCYTIKIMLFGLYSYTNYCRYYIDITRRIWCFSTDILYQYSYNILMVGIYSWSLDHRMKLKISVFFYFILLFFFDKKLNFDYHIIIISLPKPCQIKYFSL